MRNLEQMGSKYISEPKILSILNKILFTTAVTNLTMLITTFTINFQGKKKRFFNASYHIEILRILLLI